MFNDLIKHIRGEVYVDEIRKSLLSTDGSIFMIQPSCIVYPKNTEDVVQTVHFANLHGLSIHPRGAGSGLCGSALGKGIVIDFTKYMNRLKTLDIEHKWFECEPGYRLGELESALKGKGLFFPPDPSSGEYATFGGMYGTNASGAHSVKYGNVADYILDAEVVLSGGQVIILSEIIEKPYHDLPNRLKSLYMLYTESSQKIEQAYPNIRYNVSGYNLRGLVKDERLDLRRLFAGSEGTLGIVTQLKFRLIDKPRYDSLVVAFFDNIIFSARAVQQILHMGPSGIEMMDKSLLNLAKENDEKLKQHIPGGIDNVLLIEFDSMNRDTCIDLAVQVKQMLFNEGFSTKTFMAVSAEEKEKFWAVRKAAVPILYKLKGQKKVLALIEDAAVPIDRIEIYIKGLYDILTRHGVDFVLYGHIAKGLLHTRPLLNLKDALDVELLKILADDVFDLVHGLEGTISGEHGDGRIRSAYIRKQYPEIYDLFVKTKHLLDEQNIFNPNIKAAVDPNQMKKMLRADKKPNITNLSSFITHDSLFSTHHFSEEIEKCHGCSKCTTVTGATRMCPVYKITRDETAAPKAKANVLRALISGVFEERALYENNFRQVMDACINCGSCYNECPSNVNIPKLAIEAIAAYVRRFGTSFQDRLLVNVEIAGKMIHKLPEIGKKILDFEHTRKIGEMLTGISAKRPLTHFPVKTLFEKIQFKEGHGRIRVLFFAGCYASYIRPEIGEAAIALLKHIGCTVFTPVQHCCALPMISKGMTTQAKQKISSNFKNWSHLLEQVDHIVVTCSSCGFTLMQEWGYLMNNDTIEKVKQKVIHISSLLNRNIHRIDLKTKGLKLSYHLPCHLKAQPDSDCSVKLLSRIKNIFIEELKGNCCGMAGTWGLAADHYELSKRIGADMIRNLNASDSAVGVTDCPTCRVQMENFGSKPVRHPVEIIAGCVFPYH